MNRLLVVQQGEMVFGKDLDEFDEAGAPSFVDSILNLIVRDNT